MGACLRHACRVGVPGLVRAECTSPAPRSPLNLAGPWVYFLAGSLVEFCSRNFIEVMLTPAVSSGQASMDAPYQWTGRAPFCHFLHWLWHAVPAVPGCPLTHCPTPQELYVKVVVFLAVTQAMGGFLMVMNHKFGGFLLVRKPKLTCTLASSDPEPPL